MQPNHVPTVADLIDRFTRDGLLSRAPGTQKNYRYHLAFLRQTFGDRIAADLKPKDFGPFLAVKKGKITRVRALAVLSAIFNDAVKRWYCLDQNVVRDVTRPRQRPRDRLISQDEFLAIKALAPKRVALGMMLALLTGQRQGDIIRFKWSDIKGDELHVYQAKNRKRLAISINEDLEAVLDQCWLCHGESEYVLPTSRGTPYTPEGFRSGWQYTHRKWLKAGGEIAHFHDIRALAATRCETPEIAMRLLGHTSLVMTTRVYRRGIERVEALPLWKK